MLVTSGPVPRVAIVLIAGGAGFIALLASPVGRAYFGALRDASVTGTATATLNADGLESESSIAFVDANGYKDPSDEQGGRHGVLNDEEKRR
jgi:hypothetical protein